MSQPTGFADKIGFVWGAADLLRGDFKALREAAEPPQRPDEQIVYLGRDRRGKALEVMTVDLGQGVELVIHAMPLRPKYRAAYERRERR